MKILIFICTLKYPVLGLYLVGGVEDDMKCDQSSMSYTADRKYSSRKAGTYMIQSLMSVTDGEPCDLLTIGGLIRVQAVKYAINTRTVALNLSIGYQIDDSCLNLPITMARGIEIVRSQKKQTCFKDNSGVCSLSSQHLQDGNSAKSGTVLAVIGGYFSFTTIPLSSLLSAFSIPQLSYGASSPILSKKTEYKTTFRSIPSDERAVEAMVDVIKEFGWTYIYAVGSDDEYGKIGLRLLKKHASESGICITGEMYIPFESSNTHAVAKKIAEGMKEEDNATVVIMFNYALQMGEYILQEADKLNLSRLYLTSEAWNPEVLSTTSIPANQLESIITVSLDYGKTDSQFIEYVNDTLYSCFKTDIWLNQYIFQQFNCSISSRQGNLLNGTSSIDSNSTCSVFVEEVLQNIKDDNPNQINNLIDLVDSVNYALDSIVAKKCRDQNQTVSCQIDIKANEVNEALKCVNFTTRQGQKYAYDETGSPAYVSYSIEQVQLDKDTGKQKYQAVGRWQSQSESKLTINRERIKVPGWANSGKLPGSSCSRDCQPGEKVAAKQRCCWKCEKCPKNQVSRTKNSPKCQTCPVGHHTKNSVDCEWTPVRHVSVNDLIGLSTVIISLVGICLVFVCLLLLRYFGNTEVVKSLSRRFLVSSSALMIATFAYTALHLITPTSALCRLRSIYFHAVLTLFSLLLLIKNRSVARFISKFINNKQNNTKAEILLFAAVSIIEAALIVTWQIQEDFPMEKIYSSADYEYFEECKSYFGLMRMLTFALPFVIIVIASVQSLSESHTKVQFGKYKFLHYTCLAFCIINVAYIATLNLVTGPYKALVALITTIAYGYVYMGCMICTNIFHAFTEPKRRSSNTMGVCNIGFDTEHKITCNSQLPARPATDTTDLSS